MSRKERGGTLRVALAQVSTWIGDVESNKAKHIRYIEMAERDGADLVVFPELSLTGYLLRDVAYEVSGACREALEEIKEACRNIYAVVGVVYEVRRGIVCNAAAVLGDGEVKCVVPKFYLPTYGLFEEARYFMPGNPHTDLRVVNSRFGPFGTLICEDLWHPEPAEALVRLGAEFVVCIASSPLRGLNAPVEGRPWIDHAWSSLINATALTNSVHVIFVNRAGPEDEEFFWGGSRVVGPSGVELARCRSMEEDFKVCDIDLSENARARRFSSFRVHLREFHEILSKI
ncbi:MAG: nitrilase-related carbon-nitrogen hydrolase [Nitrososphaerota archaeon]|nr:amidohydrolase [Candidatus Calditenuaceae archaeon]MDW8073821.1 nitrilase-related carbon-nitrogen hydrolase [Nitrososphaerota archaeon]